MEQLPRSTKETEVSAEPVSIFARTSTRDFPSFISPVAKALTASEHHIYNFLMQGLTNLAIANKMEVSEKTIKFHITNIFKKSNVPGIKQLMARELEYYKSLTKASNV